MAELTLEYELTTDDFVAFNESFMRTSEAMRRQATKYRRLMSAIAGLSLVVVIGFGFDDFAAGVLLGTMSAVVLWWLAPRLWGRAIQRHISAMAAGEGLGVTGAYRLTASDSGLCEESPGGSACAEWAAIQRVDRTSEHVFVYSGPTQAFVVPVRAGASAVDELVSEVERRRASLTPAG